MPRSTVILSAGAVELLNDPAIVAVMRDLMEDALNEAIMSAPVDSGEYVGSLHLETVVSGDRTAVRLASDAPHALAVEARHGTLARALGSL